MSENSHSIGQSAPSTAPRHGVVALIRRQDGEAERFLVIRRSQFVSAPGAYCFPGGGVEPGEDEPTALTRELKEELDIDSAKIGKCIWNSFSRRGVALSWWTTEIDIDEKLTPDPAEVAQFHWWTIKEMRASGNLLDSNEEFLAKWESNELSEQ